MRLASVTGLTAYHITTADALPSIQKHGLTSGNAARYGHPGNGIYVFFHNQPLNFATTFAEYLMIDDPVLLQVKVDKKSLLMDEDTLDTEDEESIEKITSGRIKLPKEFVQAYEQIIYGDGDGDGDFSDDDNFDDDARKNKLIALIDQYKIKPHSKLFTDFGHYSCLTARCTLPMVQVMRIWTIGQNNEWQEAN